MYNSLKSSEETYCCWSLFVKSPLFGQLFVQFAFRRELKYEVDAWFVVEVAVQPKYIGVTQMWLDLDLSSQLMLHTWLL